MRDNSAEKGPPNRTPYRRGGPIAVEGVKQRFYPEVGDHPNISLEKRPLGVTKRLLRALGEFRGILMSSSGNFGQGIRNRPTKFGFSEGGVATT